MLWIMRQRTATVLESAVKEFIRFGKPVSSELLFEKGDFGVKSATIRAELNRLTEDGFLTQPYTSGGRVPTDDGYKFYVERILLDDGEDLKTREIAKAGDLADFVREIAEELRLLGIGYYPEEQELRVSGLHELFAKIDIITKQEVFEIIKDFEMLNERIDRILDHLSGKTPRVFIGKSPITKSRHLSVVADIYDSDGEELVLVAVGPKRMDYKKVIQRFKSYVGRN